MFSTFSADPDTLERPVGATAAPSRRKRAQVVRACDWCRLNRIKCDNRRPCQNCHEHSGYCTNTRHFEVSSLPVANREIHRLRNQIKDLQTQIDKVKEESTKHAAGANSQIRQTSVSSIAAPIGLYHMSWDGLDDQTWRTSRNMHYGPLSSQRMVMRLNRYMAGSSNPLHSETILPICILHIDRLSPTALQERLSDGADQTRCQPQLSEVEDLSREQEEHFLVLLWQAYHCVYPILEEEDFREYYDSLWTATNDQAPRQPSALVDSLLAVCMQYGSTFLADDEDIMSAGTRSQATHFDSAAHTFYRRSQHALMDALEYPSITSLQSQIYCIIYLYNIANLNTAHALLGLAIRVGQMLRLHLPTLAPLSETKQGLYSRIWWTLYQLDCHISMTLGRPPLLNVSDVHCMSLTDVIDPVHVPKSVLISPSEEDISWLSFHVQSIRFTTVARRVRDSFEAHCAELLQEQGIQNIYEDPPNLELLGRFLSQELRAIYDWVQTVPSSLQNQRRSSGQPFSTDRTPLNMDPASPLWLQRQRLLLEIIYHHVQIANFRPFIRFPPRGPSLTPVSDNHSISALNHAVVVTNILNQVLSETDLLSGWKPAFHCQWDAVICILSFVLANPVCPPTPAARKVLPTAFQNLDILGHSFAPVTNILRLIWDQFRSSPSTRGWSQVMARNQSATDKPVIPQVSVPTSAGIIAANTLEPTSGSLMMNDHSKPFGLLAKLPSNMVLETELFDPAATTPPQGELHAPFTLPSNLLMDTDIDCIPHGLISLNSWEVYGSP